MGIFFVYILKTSLCLALFYLFYRLLLSKETFHRFNRIALLGVLALSCLLPFVKVSMSEAPEVGQVFLSLEEMMVSVQEPEVVLEETSARFPWIALLMLVYVSGILFFLGRHLWSLARMLRLLRFSRKEKLEGGITLFVHQEKVAPFSWMKMIAVSEADLAENGQAILTHERAHIHNRHSCDLLLAEVCAFFQWFNPAAWLLKQELQTIHEYEADEWVIKNGIDAKTYQLLLIKKAVGARLYSIANSFNHSSLKKRITMMIKKKSNPWARMKYLYVLPLATVAVVAFARPEVSNKLDEISSVKVNDLTSIVKAEEVKSVENSSDEKFKVSGTVLEAKTKIPVVAASVLIKGTNVGTLTDFDGKFVLAGLKKGDVIQVSFVGYQTQSVVVKDASALTLLMLDDVQSMEEMTVVGHAQNGVGTPTDDSEKKVVSVVGIPEVKEAPQKEEIIFQIVEEMPEFPGGMQEAMVFLAKNIKYPVEAQKAGIEGRVIVQFVVGRDGAIRNLKVVRGVSPELDAEAMRVVGLMPKWKPGKQRGKEVAVNFSLPIVFRLNTPKAEGGSYQAVGLKVDGDAGVGTINTVKNHLRSSVSKVNVETGKSDDLTYIVVVDGVEKGKGAKALQQVPAEQIERIEVLSAKNAVAKYGDKAKDGAIEITTKKKK